MDFSQISEETLALIKATTTGMTSDTGLFGVDLGPLVSLVPVVTPFRDMLAREAAGQGSDNATWRALLNINSQQPNPFVGRDKAGGVIKTQLINVSSPYFPIAEGYSVTEDAVAYAGGYADAKAVEIFNAINQWKINEEKALLGGQTFTLGQPGTMTTSTATTGGSIAASTAVHVGVAARTLAGYFWCTGNSKGQTGSKTTGSGTATNTVTGTVASVRGAVAYDWFQSADGTTWYYYTTTVIPTVTMTSTISSNNDVPTTLPDLSTTVPTFSSSGDNGSDGKNSDGDYTQFNGLLATLAGDYSSDGPLVSYGSGTDNGSTWKDAAGSALSVAGGGISEFDDLFLSIYNKTRLSPTALMLSSREANGVSQIVLDNPGAVTYLTMNDAQGRTEIVAGGQVATYVNRSVPGATVKLEVHPHIPPGTIVARTDRVNYPNSNISNVFAARCLRDVYDYIYGSDRNSGGPRQDGEARSVETFVNRAPVACGVIHGLDEYVAS